MAFGAQATGTIMRVVYQHGGCDSPLRVSGVCGCGGQCGAGAPDCLAGSAVDGQQRLIDVGHDLAQIGDGVGGGIELENRPAGVLHVAQQPHPGRPIDDACADGGEPLDLRVVDGFVDGDVEGRWSSGIFPVGDSDALAVARHDVNGVGSGHHELGGIGAQKDVTWVGVEHK